MRGDRYGRRRRGLLAVAGLALLVTLVLAPAAWAMTAARVTIDQETGGVPTRFTYQATTDTDASTTRIDFLFPEGFETGEVLVDVTLLEASRASRRSTRTRSMKKPAL